MEHQSHSAAVWIERIGVAALFIGLGALATLVFSPWAPGPRLITPGDSASRSTDYIAKITVSLVLLTLALLARRSERLSRYWPLLFAFFVLTVTVSIQWIIGKHVLVDLGWDVDSPSGMAWQKLNEGLVVVATIVALTLASGQSLDSLYIRKGNLRLGLSVGLIAFALAAVAAIPLAAFMFQAPGLTPARVLPWVPWLLIFVLANAALEELMFRGLFLGRLQPFLGKAVSNLLVALVFTGLHYVANYTSDTIMFLAATFPLALIWGYLVQKTDALWASILFHAGMDIGIVLGLFANL